MLHMCRISNETNESTKIMFVRIRLREALTFLRLKQVVTLSYLIIPALSVPPPLPPPRFG